VHNLFSHIVPEISLEGKWGAAVGVWGLCPQWDPGAKSLVKGSGDSPTEADDDHVLRGSVSTVLTATG